MSYMFGVRIQFYESPTNLKISDLKEGRGFIFVCPTRKLTNRHHYQIKSLMLRVRVKIDLNPIIIENFRHSGSGRFLHEVVHLDNIIS